MKTMTVTAKIEVNDNFNLGWCYDSGSCDSDEGRPLEEWVVLYVAPMLEDVHDDAGNTATVSDVTFKMAPPPPPPRAK